jgi:hypothetical protein
LQLISHEKGSLMPSNLENLSRWSGSMTAPKFSSLEATHRAKLVSVIISSLVLKPVPKSMVEAEPKPAATKLSRVGIADWIGTETATELDIKL